MSHKAKPILVIGGGIAGMTAAVEAAEVGHEVVLVEQAPFLGGRVMGSHLYFPKMCPPTCGIEINVRRIRQNPRITVYTLSTVEKVTGSAGDFSARIRKRPRFVTDEMSIDESVAAQLASERHDERNLGMTKTKALYLPHEMAYPHTYLVDREALSEADAEKLYELLPPGVIDLEMQEEELDVEVAAIVVATGWRPYDATRIEHLGFGRHPNVITNVMVERLASANGPTGGEILRPSDGKAAKKVAFVQCAGSRDPDHLPYCSTVCCMASLKQSRYIRECGEDATATIFFIDMRTIDRLEKYYYELLDDEGFRCVRGKVVAIEEDPGSADLILQVEDTLPGETCETRFDLVVLATGMVPTTADSKLPMDIEYDEYGFIDPSVQTPGVFPVGCTVSPCDVSTSTRASAAAALRAIQCLGSTSTGE
jgi:quinone-modifying oxidoreductase subunit QmoA